jgi:hypothetical protein
MSLSSGTGARREISVVVHFEDLTAPTQKKQVIVRGRTGVALLLFVAREHVGQGTG